MVGSIEKSIVNTSTISVENYKTTSTIFKRYTQKIITSKHAFFKIINYGYSYLKSNLSPKRQETSPHTVKDISDLIKNEEYQDAEKKIKEMLNNGYNISDRDEGNNNLLHLICFFSRYNRNSISFTYNYCFLYYHECTHDCSRNW